MSRSSRLERITKETSVVVELDLDGTGTARVSTRVPFFDHMLAQRANHGLLDRGVLVREVGPPRWLRVTVGTPEEMAAFKSALDEVLSNT